MNQRSNQFGFNSILLFWSSYNPCWLLAFVESSPDLASPLLSLPAARVRTAHILLLSSAHRLGAAVSAAALSLSLLCLYKANYFPSSSSAL